MQAWKISRFAEVNKEWWLLLSLFIIGALVNAFGGGNHMILFLFMLPTLASAYLYGQRHATLTAFASIFLVLAGIFIRQILMGKHFEATLVDTAWFELAAWAGILVIFGYATGRLFREMHESYGAFLQMLRYLLLRDESDTVSVRRISGYAAEIAEEMGLNRDDVEVVRAAALLQDISNLGISSDVLAKAARLTANVQLEQGTAYKDDELMKLRKVLPIVIAQGNKKTERPIAAKIIDVADEYDNLVTGRDRSKPIHPSIVRDMIDRASGVRFDSEVVKAFVTVFDRGALNAEPLATKS